MHALIVDDEDLGRSALAHLIKKHCPEITSIVEAKSVKESLEILKKTHVDVVFLDIEMPGGSGFSLLEKLENYTFSVIFTTAYNQYAIRAFKFSAVDYLLKPIDADELKNAIKKIEKKTDSKQLNESVKYLLNTYNLPIVSKIALPTQIGLEFIEIKNIIRCEADGKYTICILTSGKKIISTRSLKDFEELLVPNNFFRIHHAHLVNLEHIKNYFKGDGGYIVMSNGDNVTISKRKKDAFLKKLPKV
ncbi:MAG: LytTR family DNA-binding domain-containing protein [Bacteroidia bacterium]